MTTDESKSNNNNKLADGKVVADEKSDEEAPAGNVSAKASILGRGRGRGQRKGRKGRPAIRYAIMSHWTPADPALVRGYINQIRQHVNSLAADAELLPPVQALADLINNTPSIKFLAERMMHQNEILIIAENPTLPEFGRATTVDGLLHGISHVISGPPPFFGEELIGVPLAAWLTGPDATLAGMSLFVNPDFNNAFKEILQYWHVYLSDPESGSNSGFTQDGVDWMSKSATDNWKPAQWAKESETLPYYKSWNSFFTRQWLNPLSQRPVSDPENSAIVTSCNDGMVFRWRDEIEKEDTFWFKDMPYSIHDIFSSDNAAQQALLDEHKLVERFTGGTVFQTFLNPFDYHRWWTPAAGKLLFAPFSIPGTYFSKLQIPDFDGGSTGSLPYLLQVNARGMCVVDTGADNIGLVACIPIGMCEVSTVAFHSELVAGADIAKGTEIGMFQFGGSSFALVFEDVSKYGKKITFKDSAGNLFAQDPEQPVPGGGTGTPVVCGAQIAVIEAAQAQ